MLIEQAAYTNRWRRVCPAAKGVFAVGGLVAAYCAGTPVAALAVATVLVLTTLVGARVEPGLYLRVLGAPLLFLLLGGVSLALSFNPEQGGFAFDDSGMQQAAFVLARALAAITALLFLSMTTPLADLVGLLRRCRVPDTLLELMVVAYRMLFVFSDARRDIACAQGARLGYATTGRAWRSLGGLLGALVVQIWQRAADLHVAAQARNSDGPLRFLARPWPHAGRETALASGAAGVLLTLILCHRFLG